MYQAHHKNRPFKIFARDSILLSAHMLSQFRPSVCPSVTRVDHSRVKMRSASLNPQKIATKHFFAFTTLMGHGESQKKSLGSSDPGDWVNLHIFTMAAIENFNVLQTFYGWF